MPAREAGAPTHTHRPEPNDPPFISGEWVGWYVVIDPCRTVSYEINALLLQYTLNLLNIIYIRAGNADAAVDIAITVLNNFKLKRDTVQTEDDLPAQ